VPGFEWGDEFAGAKVVLTGAAGVYGRWIARAFTEAGARLCLTDADAGALAALARELGVEAKGGLARAVDLLDAGGVDAFAASVGAAWRAPDVLINNAGIYPSGFLVDIDADEWDRILGVNLRAPFLLARAFARQMIGAGVRGAIVNVSSGASRKMRRSVVPYCLSKTALDRLTKGFALELAEFGIRVNAIEPGFAAGSTASPLAPAHVEATLAQIPLGRASGPRDAADAIMYLCSSRAGYVTGATLGVDGGIGAGTLAVYQDKRRPG
jgi:3-oxoacyl-[acyl-carrier protein] reductase